MPTESQEPTEPLLKIRESHDFTIVLSSGIRVEMSKASNPAQVVARRKKDGRTSTFVLKAVARGSLIAVAEAVAGDMYRLVSIDASAKTRVIRIPATAPGHRRQYATVSKVAADGRFIPVKDLSPAELGILKRDHKKELAQFIVALYSFAEVDAHSGNWGVIKTADGRMRILKIDHDMSFFNLLGKAHGLAKPEDYYELQEYYRSVGIFPNIIYDYYETADITQHDITTLPHATFIKPHHWPADKNSMIGGMPEIASAVFDGLERDEEFAKYKYFEFAKMFLISDANIEAICRAHATSDTHDDKLNRYLTERMKMLRDTLMRTPEFRACFTAHQDEFMQELRTHIDSYNRQFVDKTTGEIKEKYRGTGFLLSSDRVEELAKNIEEIQAMPSSERDALDIAHKRLELERAIERTETILSIQGGESRGIYTKQIQERALMHKYHAELRMLSSPLYSLSIATLPKTTANPDEIIYAGTPTPPSSPTTKTTQAEESPPLEDEKKTPAAIATGASTTPTSTSTRVTFRPGYASDTPKKPPEVYPDDPPERPKRGR